MTNIWGNVPDVVEMQSEGGAAGAVHGALQAGALTTTFTASQGLLLMIPNMYKIAGELTPAVFHVAARSVAAQALSIFGDHSDVMAARPTGFAMLASGSVQEAQDLALIAQAATLEARVPFVHFFDGFRTSHEINKMTLLGDDEIRAMIDDELCSPTAAARSIPDHPVLRGTAQNPDVFFQARETVNQFYARSPAIVEACMARFGALTGRRYRLFDYFGPRGRAGHRAHGLGRRGRARDGRSSGVARREGRRDPGAPLPAVLGGAFPRRAARQRAKAIAVLDRTKEPGAAGEPLYHDVVTSLAEAAADGAWRAMPRLIGGRYGLSSKEFTPAMVKAVFDELAADRAEEPLHRRHQRRRHAHQPRL